MTKEEQLNSAYKKVFLGSPEGQLVFWDLMNRGFLFRAFNQQNAGAYAMEGKREFVLDIFKRVEFTPSLGEVSSVHAVENMRKSIDMAAKLIIKEDD